MLNTNISQETIRVEIIIRKIKLLWKKIGNCVL